MPSLHQKLMITAIATTLFVIVSMPLTYKLVDDVLPLNIASWSGCPTTTGLVVHTVVFAVATLLLMQPWKTTTTDVVAVSLLDDETSQQ